MADTGELLFMKERKGTITHGNGQQSPEGQATHLSNSLMAQCSASRTLHFGDQKPADGGDRLHPVPSFFLNSPHCACWAGVVKSFKDCSLARCEKAS